MIYRLGENKVVGVKQTIKAIKNNTAKTVYIAKDADEKLIQSVKEIAIQNSLEIIVVHTMKELGKLCGIDVGAATCALIKE